MNRKVAIIWAVILALMPITIAAQDVGDGSTTPWDSLSSYALWSIAAGLIGSWVMALVNQTHWSSLFKFATVFAWCVIASAVTAYYKRELDLADWSRSLLLVFLASQAMFFAAKPAIKELEVKTTFLTPSP